MIGRCILVLVLAVLPSAPRRVSIAVVPQIVMANHGLIVSCHVPRNPANRGLDVTLYPVQSTYRQLDGNDAAITTTVAFGQVPCDAERVACELHTQGESNTVVSLGIVVAGCGH